MANLENEVKGSEAPVLTQITGELSQRLTAIHDKLCVIEDKCSNLHRLPDNKLLKDCSPVEETPYLPTIAQILSEQLERLRGAENRLYDIITHLGHIV